MSACIFTLLWLSFHLCDVVLSAPATTGSTTIFLAARPTLPPTPSTQNFCEYTSYHYTYSNYPNIIFNVELYPGSMISGQCEWSGPGLSSTTSLGVGGSLVAGPKAYILDIHGAGSTGRVESCTIFSTLSDSQTIMSCEQHEYGTYTNTVTVHTSFTRTYEGYTPSYTESYLRSPTTLSGATSWTAVLAAQTTIAPLSVSKSSTATSDSTFPTSAIVVIAVIGFLAIVFLIVGAVIRSNKAGKKELAKEEGERMVMLQSQKQETQAEEMRVLSEELIKLREATIRGTTASSTLDGSAAPARNVVTQPETEVAQLHARIAQLETEMRTQIEPPPYRPFDTGTTDR